MKRPNQTDAGYTKSATLPLREHLRERETDPDLPLPVRLLAREAREALEAGEVALLTAQASYRALFDAVPDPVTILGEDGTVLDFNRAGTRLFKRDREDVVGKNIRVLNPDLPTNHMRPVLAALDRGETHVIEVTNTRSDGTRFPVEVHSAAIDHDGQRAVLAVARDMSKRWELEGRYADLIESADQGIVVQDRNGETVHVNSAAMRILDLRGDERNEANLQSEQWLVIDEHGNPLPRDRLAHAVAARTGKVVRSRVVGVYRVADSRFRWLRVTAIPQFPLDSGLPDQTVTLFSDITDLKRDSAMFERVQQLARIGSWEWHRSQGTLYVSRGAMRVLEIANPPQSLDAFMALFQPQDAQRLSEAIPLAYARQQPLALELRGKARRSDVDDRWFRLQAEVDPGDPSGQRLTGTLEDITERKRVEHSLRTQALTDPLTNLLNRDAALDELRAYLAGTDPRVAVLYIDLDRFKVINDALGHSVGDKLLVEVAQRLHEAVGDEGVCARLGGDEFLVLCRLHESELHVALAERILSALTKPFHVGQEDLTVSASIGIAEAPQDGETEIELIQNADAAMYDSKRRGYNSWQSYSTDLAQRQHDKLQLDTLIRNALGNSELQLVYQPQVDMRTGEIVGAEALMRWDNPSLGMMRPDLFIGHAENTGEIVRLGAWALREACMQIRRWRDAGLETVRVAVNVSYRQFLADDLPGTVEAALSAAGIPGSALEIEFTERVLIEDSAETMHAFGALRELGVMLSIDDFGEGYSGLNYLRRLPIHGLKLSQLFLQGVPDNKSDVAVCQAVSAIAHSLGLGLVAEGVENKQQQQFLLDLGVPVAQGFLYSKPLKADEFARMLSPATLPA